MNDKQGSRTLRVGALVAGSLIILMVFLFFIGSERKVFSKKNSYQILLENAAGLAEGNPVRISGVTVGSVHDIWLPRDPKQDRVRIEIAVVQKYSERIRTDSRVKLRKLGLLTGDSYIDISAGSPDQPVLPPGSVIPAAKATDVDQLISSGEDLVDNFVEISYSMKNILGRIDRGEGLLGELTQSPETKQRVIDTLLLTLNKTNALLSQVESGRGVLGKLVYDDEYGSQVSESLSTSLASLQSITGTIQGSFESGSGALPLLISDPDGKKRVETLLTNLDKTSTNLAAFSASLKEGEGLVPRLVTDKGYADDTLREFQDLVRQLKGTVEKLNNGEGTAGRLIADPSVYESINDILIGINESKLLRWLVRSRQAKGIETRYKAARSAADHGELNQAPAPEQETSPSPEVHPVEPMSPAPQQPQPAATPSPSPAVSEAGDTPSAADTTSVSAQEAPKSAAPPAKEPSPEAAPEPTPSPGTIPEPTPSPAGEQETPPSSPSPTPEP